MSEINTILKLNYIMYEQQPLALMSRCNLSNSIRVVHSSLPSHSLSHIDAIGRMVGEDGQTLSAYSGGGVRA